MPCDNPGFQRPDPHLAAVTAFHGLRTQQDSRSVRGCPRGEVERYLGPMRLGWSGLTIGMSQWQTAARHGMAIILSSSKLVPQHLGVRAISEAGEANMSP